MNTTDYWPFTREYSIWNAAVAVLKFSTADLEPHILSNAIEQVYTDFFYSTSMHLLCNQSEEVLFGHFVTILNAAFKSRLALEDEGYESGSENFNIPTPLWRTSRIHHDSSDENVSFDPSNPCTTATSQSHCKPVCHQLSFSSSEEEEENSAVHNLPNCSTLSMQNLMGFMWQSIYRPIYPIHDDPKEEEEDFQTVDLNDEHWITDPVPDRLLCIHEHLQPHSLCPYPFPCCTESAPVS